MRNFLLQPRVTGHHSDAEHLRLWRLNQQQNRLLIRSRWTRRVLVDNDLPLIRRLANRKKTRETKQNSNRGPFPLRVAKSFDEHGEAQHCISLSNYCQPIVVPKLPIAVRNARIREGQGFNDAKVCMSDDSRLFAKRELGAPEVVVPWPPLVLRHRFSRCPGEWTIGRTPRNDSRFPRTGGRERIGFVEGKELYSLRIRVNRSTGTLRFYRLVCRCLLRSRRQEWIG